MMRRIIERTYGVFVAVAVLSILITIVGDVFAYLKPPPALDHPVSISAFDVLMRGPQFVFPGPLSSPLGFVWLIARENAYLTPITLAALAAPVVALMVLGAKREASVKVAIMALVVGLSIGSDWVSLAVTKPLLEAALSGLAS